MARLNAKTCKVLRREARALTVGKPARRLIGANQRVNQHKRPSKTGSDGKRLVYTAQCAMNDPYSTRGVYRDFKRAARRG